MPTRAEIKEFQSTSFFEQSLFITLVYIYATSLPRNCSNIVLPFVCFFSSVRIRNLERVHVLLTPTPAPKCLPWLCARLVNVPFVIVRLICKRYRFYLRGERFVQRFLFRLVSSLLCKARCNLRSYIISGLMSLP
jgi:hypothetical protein